MVEAKKTTQYLNHLHFGFPKVKEAVKVIMAEEANEATEVIRFT